MATQDLWKARCEMGKKKGVITLADDGLYWQQDGYVQTGAIGFRIPDLIPFLPFYPAPPPAPPLAPPPPLESWSGMRSVNT